MSECLSFSKIMQLADAAAPAAEADREHLESCPKCQEQLRLARDDGELEAQLRVAEREVRRFASTTMPLIGDYQLVREIGRGGMGVIYEAIQRRLNRRVALKILPALMHSFRPESAARFRAEAAAAAKLQHPHIVPIYDYGEEAGCHYYAMELIHGQPMSEIILRYGRYSGLQIEHESTLSMARGADRDEEGDDLNGVRIEALNAARRDEGLTPIVRDLKAPASLDVNAEEEVFDLPFGDPRVFRPNTAYFRQVAEWIADVADALQFAHDRGVVHRDIKPSNLMLCRTGRLMVTDFGLAKDVRDPAVTRSGQFMGTLRYMSPEQVRADGVTVDARTDIYSLGATLYEMLTLRPAMPGGQDHEVMRQVLGMEPTPVRRITPRTPQELEIICAKSMAKDSAARYASAAEVSADLRRYLNDEPIVARRAGVHRRLLKFVRRHRLTVALVLATALAVTSVVSTAAYFNLSRKELESRSAIVADLTSLARGHFEAGNYHVAADVYSRALTLDPSPPAYLYASRALAYAEVGRVDEAIVDLTRAIRIAPQRSGAYLNRGVLYLVKADQKAASSDFERAVASNPNDEEAGVFLLLSHTGAQIEEPALPTSKPSPLAKNDCFALLAAYLSGSGDAEAVLAAAATDRARALVLMALGEKNRLDGNTDAARANYEQCVETDDSTGIVRLYCLHRAKQTAP